eukprot:TRINITY_DN1457_c0_g1_i4.p1 TRINITY_DN1457_c0_g1~~TRINITY_DN1457_c0_g1_i4.p1  ORF type:complete len:168 (-),score=13.02 TRINITY_DN1457_c0_g1_i4:215-718(-)
MTEAYTDDRRDGGGGMDNETEAANINGDPANTDGITIVIHDKPEESSFDEKDIENIKNISKCHIITGCITIFLQVATVLFPHSIMFVVYEGVVTGLIFIVTGIIGTCYIIKKTAAISILFSGVEYIRQSYECNIISFCYRENSTSLHISSLQHKLLLWRCIQSSCQL